MSIGICTRWQAHEACYVAIRLADWLEDRGYDVSILSTTYEKVAVDPHWDHRLQPRDNLITEWSKLHDWVIWTHCPHHLQASWVSERCNTAVVALWHEISMRDRESYKSVDCVISPSHKAAHFLKSRWNIRNSTALPWDTGLPFTRKGKHSLDQIALLLPLFDGLPRRTEMTALDVVGRALYRYPNTTLTVGYNSSTLATFGRRRLDTFKKYFPGRVKLISAVPYRDRPHLFKSADLTIWPTHAESTGMVGLTSITMGTPVLAFAIPPVDEFLNPNNAVLANPRSVGNDLGVPSAVPEYDELECKLWAVLDNPHFLGHLHQTVLKGLDGRRTVFGDVLSQLFC